MRSLYKIATMLQMTKLAQYCQNFAHQLQEEAEEGSAAVDDNLNKMSVNIGELGELHAQRQRLLEAQVSVHIQSEVPFWEKKMLVNYLIYFHVWVGDCVAVLV